VSTDCPTNFQKNGTSEVSPYSPTASAWINARTEQSPRVRRLLCKPPTTSFSTTVSTVCRGLVMSVVTATTKTSVAASSDETTAWEQYGGLWFALNGSLVATLNVRSHRSDWRELNYVFRTVSLVPVSSVVTMWMGLKRVKDTALGGVTTLTAYNRGRLKEL